MAGHAKARIGTLRQGFDRLNLPAQGKPATPTQKSKLHSSIKESSMKTGENTRAIERYIALDIHKEYVLAGGMNARQEWVMQPRRIEMGRFRE
jgi:hypothetical protein